MIVFVREMGEIRPARRNPPRCCQRLIQAHVRRMRRAPQRIQHCHLRAGHLLDDFPRHLLAIAQVCQPLHARLREQKSGRRDASVRQGQGSDLQIAKLKFPVNQMRLRHEVTLGPRPVVEGIDEHAPQRHHRLGVRVDRQRPAAQIAKPPAIVQPHDVVRVWMREDHRVQPPYPLAQHLDAKLRRRVHHEFYLVRGHINRRPGAMVLRVRQECRWIFDSHHRHPLRSPRSQKRERK